MSENRFRKAFENRGLAGDKTAQAIAASLTWEIALVVDPGWATDVPDKVFLAKVLGSNPRYTGWPIWLDSRSFRNVDERPMVHDAAWEALIFSPGTDGLRAHLEFMRFDPRGNFYLRRTLQDDLVPEKVHPGTALDPVLTIIRVAEAIAVGIAIANALIEGGEEPRQLGFAFRWSGLKYRILKPWANPMVMMIGEPRALDNQVATYVELASNTPLSAIAPFVGTATRDLFARFEGELVPPRVIEEWTSRLIERRLP